MRKLWHIHSATGKCYGYSTSYETAFAVAMQLYEECGRRMSFFATQDENSRLGPEALPNS